MDRAEVEVHLKISVHILNQGLENK